SVTVDAQTSSDRRAGDGREAAVQALRLDLDDQIGKSGQGQLVHLLVRGTLDLHLERPLRAVSEFARDDDRLDGSLLPWMGCRGVGRLDFAVEEALLGLARVALDVEAVVFSLLEE